MGQRLTGPVRVALAEDEPDLRIAMERLLERLGHRVVCSAANGAELLACCAEQEVDLAVLDFDMPLVDGLTAAEELAAHGIPAVLVSGHPDAQDMVLEHEPVVTRILKPASLETLREAIRQALAK